MKFRWVVYLVIALATLSVWGHTVRFEFTWDDRQFIEENTSIRSWAQLPAMLTRREGQSSLPEHFCLYRPVRTVAYALLNTAGGGPLPKPWFYHAANIAGHALAAMLLCGASTQLLTKIGGNPPNTARIAGMLLGLAYAVHPAVSEVVCWAKSFDDILAVVFCLAALVQLLAWQEGNERRLWFAVAFFVLAEYSKESAITFPLVALAYFWFLLKLPLVRSVKLSSGFFLAAAVFVVHRHVVLGQTSQTAPISGTYWQSLVDTIPCVFAYVRLALGIPPFTIVYAHLEHGRALTSAPVLLGGLALAGGILGAIVALKSERWRLLGFGLWWALAFFIPVSNVVPMMQFMAERFMYLPLVGVLLTAGVMLLQIQRGRLVVIGACTTLVMWAAVAWDRSWVWSDDLTLFVDTAMNNPRNHVIENNAADAILELPAVTNVIRAKTTPSPKEVQAAISSLAKAHSAFPANGPIANALGVAWVSAGDCDEAIKCFRIAVSALPANAMYARNLGQAMIDGGRLADAERVLRQLRQFHENDVGFLRMFCAVLLTQKGFEEAQPLIFRLKGLDPGNAEYDQWLAEAQSSKKNEAGGRP